MIVDPERDDVARIKQYLVTFDPGFIGGTLRMRTELLRVLGEERHGVLRITHDVEEAILKPLGLSLTSRLTLQLETAAAARSAYPAAMTRPHHSWAAAALIFSSLLGACATAPPSVPTAPPAPPNAPINAADIKRQADFNKSQDSWTGAKVQELVAKLGPPTSRARQPDGTPAYVYVKSVKSGTATTFSCVVRYFVDARNERVTGHQIEGC